MTRREFITDVEWIEVNLRVWHIEQGLAAARYMDRTRNAMERETARQVATFHQNTALTLGRLIDAAKQDTNPWCD